MNISKDKENNVVIELGTNTKILDYQIEMVNNNQGKGLLYIEKRQFNFNVSFKYNFSDCISLNELIDNDNTSISDIVISLKSIIWIIKSMKEYLLYEENIVFDLNYIFVNDNKVNLVYIPTKLDKALNYIVKIEKVFEEVACKINDTNDLKKKQLSNKILQILNSKLSNIDLLLDALSEFENKQINNNRELYIPKKLEDNLDELNIHEENEKIKKQGFLSKLFKLNRDNDDKNINNTEEFMQKIKLSSREISINKNHTDSSLDYSTYILFKENGAFRRVDINSKKFVVGRLFDSVDCFINDNAVSKKHAQIVLKNNKKYLIDLNSSNGTFLNGVKIETEKYYELRNNDKITFANVESIFKDKNIE